MIYEGALTDIEGLKVGHAQDTEAKTGCTVVLCDGAVGGVDVRGSAPGTRETDLLRPGQAVERINAIVLSGGSAYGLAASCGVMDYLEERGIGFHTGKAIVPIVCSAVIYDLECGSSKIRPDAKMGYAAAAAASAEEKRQGKIGAGTGATVGKILGMENSADSGLGMASIYLPGGVIVSALVVVNAVGDVYDIDTGEILAGPKDGQGGFINTSKLLLSRAPELRPGTNTTVGVIATNAALDKAAVNKMASIAHDGLAIAVRPVHTMMDGDTLFGLSLGDKIIDSNIIFNAAVVCTARAVNNAILTLSKG